MLERFFFPILSERTKFRLGVPHQSLISMLMMLLFLLRMTINNAFLGETQNDLRLSQQLRCKATRPASCFVAVVDASC